MKQKIQAFIEKHTSGYPLLVWLVLWMAVFAFFFIFRSEPNIDFERLRYVVLLGLIWSVGSDVVRKKKLISLRTHIILDTLFSIIFYNTIIHFSGGVGGGMMITLVLAMISAPFFMEKQVTLSLVSILPLSVLFFHIFFIHNPNYYEIGLIVIQLVSSVAIFAMVRHYSSCEQRGGEERIISARKEVEFKAQELQKTLEELNRNRSALRDKISKLEQFQKLVVGRELKMIELKTRLRELEDEIGKIKSEKEK